MIANKERNRAWNDEDDDADNNSNNMMSFVIDIGTDCLGANGWKGSVDCQSNLSTIIRFFLRIERFFGVFEHELVEYGWRMDNVGVIAIGVELFVWLFMLVWS